MGACRVTGADVAAHAAAGTLASAILALPQSDDDRWIDYGWLALLVLAGPHTPRPRTRARNPEE